MRDWPPGQDGSELQVIRNDQLTGRRRRQFDADVKQFAELLNSTSRAETRSHESGEDLRLKPGKLGSCPRFRLLVVTHYLHRIRVKRIGTRDALQSEKEL